jgi:DNA-nicking Smr family endonuclease
VSARGRRRRELSEAEKALWAQVAETVVPLAGRPAAEPEPAKAPAQASPVPPAAGTAPPAQAKAASAPSALLRPAPGPPPLAPLEPKLRRRLSRGVVAVDARIDLHGMRQDEAQMRLAGFLAQAQAASFKVVLVITGKGKPSEPGDAAFGFERGVLKRAVPLWLGSPAARRYVVGYETAHATHGGAGALYVRIRKRG